MAARTASLVRSLGILPIFLSVICLLAPAEAQHGGGGGHSGGGHFGGGHSSGRHSGGSRTGGHFGWLHFGRGKQPAGHAGLEASSASDTSSHLPSDLRNVAAPARRPSNLRIPPTLLWSPPPFPPRPSGRVSFVSSLVRPHHLCFFPSRFPRFFSSACFFNGVTQVCFFEPFLPLLSFSGGFDPFYSGFGFGGDSFDVGDGLQGPTQSDMSAIPPTPNRSDNDTEDGNLSVRPGATVGVATEDRDLGKGVFVLVLNNGTSHAVTDYWAADGYLEYVSPDGARSHIPLEALDLQNTVIRNAPRGLPFVLRSAPAQDR